jgi:hypothetical protein
MKKVINKLNFIREAAEAYENDLNLSLRRAATLHNVHYISITNYFTNKIKPAPDYFITYQKITLIEENILEQYIFRAYNIGFPLSIQYFNYWISVFSDLYRFTISNWSMNTTVMKRKVFLNANGYNGY